MTFMIPEFIQYFFSHIMLNMIIYPQFLDHSKIHVQHKNQETKLSKRLPSSKDRIIQGDEVEMVMGNLGILCNFDGDYFSKNLNSEDLLNMFEEEQPRLDEVKEAFDVFDENKDGFIDARELQRVLSALGLKDKTDIDDCKKMIKVFDDNKDGRIDFDEFIKFMEGTF
ncbi:putative EF-hand domain pair protein CML [Helianthus annuus]|uniref:EH domain, EF-hand domain pair protein n=1 Tax=Helianthus annuus TaxID=4232 RepID=A0A251RNT7_HELAN|nr:probable calcium-binding protein CML46 [Helianthus annuus]KAF5754985.1 putative EH domain, EF-hand domain pair protein [Helianthus annuus]KAJ0428794.1 putative EF-hand domain-containing protein [Helianthus annuus]KAJ0447122.1 putative EF-hand domain-containing protein [Helianthus annuus]KAJ0632027.1 putative EF-hand domain-containing protein [Helianthus annuus]KAJ0635912.1 putative EF-hand domain-containing protein [Helianthus annuus]